MCSGYFLRLKVLGIVRILERSERHTVACTVTMNWMFGGAVALKEKDGGHHTFRCNG
jgi:hypothetical protein